MLKKKKNMVCPEKEMPPELFGREIVVEYRLQDQRGDLVNFLTVKEDVSFFELEKQIFNKSQRWLILEIKMDNGRTQIRDDDDLAREIQRVKKVQGTLKEGEKLKLSFTCVVNMENKPIAVPRATTASAKQSTKVTAVVQTETTQNVKRDAQNVSQEDFTQLKSILAEGFTGLNKDIARMMNKMTNQSKFAAQQSNDIYEEIQHVKQTDRDFIHNAL